MNYAFEIASDDMIYKPSFMKIGKGVHAISRCCFKKTRKASMLVLVIGGFSAVRY
jgi:hypothetical protein